MAKKYTPVLVPIDVDHADTFSCFRDQRVICGWKYDEDMIRKIFDTARRGDRHLFWICVPISSVFDIPDSVFSDAHSTEGVESHLDQAKKLFVSKRGDKILGVWPAAESAISPAGTATNSDRGDAESIALPVFGPDAIQAAMAAATMTTSEEIPETDRLQTAPQIASHVAVGHISADYLDFDGPPSPLLGSGDGRTISLTTLFILPCFRRFGLATASLLQAEHAVRSGMLGRTAALRSPVSSYTPDTEEGTVANKPKLPCEVVALSTLSERHFKIDAPDSMGLWERTGGAKTGRGMDRRKVRYLGDWYRALGYERVGEMPKFKDYEVAADGTVIGEVWWYGEIWNKPWVRASTATQQNPACP